jgi:transcription initiation factor TFIIIB Brf1 subunit/transcription initiation factor TFIIB
VVFIASRIEKQPKGIKEILQVDQVSHKELSSCYKKVKELLPELKNQVQLDARQIANTAANRLNLPMDVNNAARSVTEAITKL